MDTVLTIEIVAVALFAGFCVVGVIPACNMSIFRYRLWDLRDRLADEIRAGRFDDDQLPGAFLKFVESSIVHARNIGAVKLLFVRWSARNVPCPPLFDLDDLSRDDKRRLGAYESEFRGLLVRHILFGNPSGWALTIVMVPIALLASVIARGSRRGDGGSVINDARSRVRDEMDPGMALLGGSPSSGQQSLSQMI
jgi:hypothetical protein